MIVAGSGIGTGGGGVGVIGSGDGVITNKDVDGADAYTEPTINRHNIPMRKAPDSIFLFERGFPSFINFNLYIKNSGIKRRYDQTIISRLCLIIQKYPLITIMIAEM
jgi:hypothetical protein